MILLRCVSWWHTCHSRKKSNDVDCQGGDFGSLFCRNTTLIIINPFDKNNTMVSMTTTCPMLGGGFWGDCKGGTPCRTANLKLQPLTIVQGEVLNWRVSRQNLV